MRFDVITLFPAMFAVIGEHGVVARAGSRGLWSLNCWNPRDFTQDPYRRVDDRPYGGGPGMVMMGRPLADTLAGIADARLAGGDPVPAGPVICLSPQGQPADHALVARLAGEAALTLIAGRYEGIDQRFLDRHVDLEVAIGDIVVSGGELPAMMLIDAIVRLLPGVLNDPDSAVQDSFATGILDCPPYTRPELLDGDPVPDVLRGGNHAQISAWRRRQALIITWRRRPDLIERARREGRLGPADEAILAALAD
ncbi:MAG: tRNA (guanosine(37)-N1)-methyltransferase TrmD [Burkholderiaceae bacterium]